ncbi:hypothetical protein QQS21_003015 [Conoideocrella luteorostrata]|uniref:DUF8035 domain-containing protein n=1 Tax=Conoideocrella luteorostrata TaxID=1105319 RepID=A0AAJ0CU64_9HYPO|nr:hypothetical protein QQS21_003015 [Conoideocrella luteorostrata]
MSERYQGYVPTAPGRSPTHNPPMYNPARSSMPSSVGYSSMYAGDMHVVPSASHRHHITPRGYSTSTTASGVPTTTRTYTVTQDPRTNSKTRDSSKTRRSTLDSVSRPPVIITTTQLDRPNGSSSHTSNARSGSPIRDDYRASDGQVYSQPASSIRSRSSARSNHVATSSADHGRYRERADSHLRSHDLEAYRNSRPSVVYPSDPRHSTAAIDYGDDGYQYTNVGELVKYDLDQSKPGRSTNRHDSFDTGYYRPNVNYDADRRNFNVNTSHDLNRAPAGLSRQAEGRGGPPPSTRGFEKINRGYDSRDLPPVVPVPPSPTSSNTQLEIPGRSGSRRPRPLSLHQEGGLRSSHHDDYHRSREDERVMRDLRDMRDLSHDRERDHDRRPEPPRYHDDGVTTRGFGIRTDLVGLPTEVKERRRDARLDEPRKRSDEDLPYVSDKDKENRRRSRQPALDDLRDRKHDKREGSQESQDQQERSRVRDSLATGLGAVATAVGLVPALVKSSQDKQDQESPGPKRRRSPPEERDIRKEEMRAQDARQPIERTREPVREKEPIKDRDPLLIREKDPSLELRNVIKEKESVREREPNWEREPAREKEYVREREPMRENAKDYIEPARHRHTVDSRANGEISRLSGSDSDDTKRSGRSRVSTGFNPNDASDIKHLKEQLASMDSTEKRRERELERPAVAERQHARSRSPSKDRTSHGSPRGSPRDEIRDDSRGRELAVPPLDGKQVRLVSPPRDKSDGKPLKGILKQPKVSFPEDENPVREGVAPHKEDKKLKDAPPGARWTKISREKVNPEALTVGNERFEVRDDFVIVLRVLSREEIVAYAAATQVLRERRRNKNNGDKDREDDRGRERERGHDADRDQDNDGSEDTERHHRHRRHRDNEGMEGREREKEREKDKDRDREAERDRKRDYDRDEERRRNQRREDEEDYESRSKDSDHRHHHHHNPRSFRERERELDVKD